MHKKLFVAAAIFWTVAITVLSLISLSNVTVFNSVAGKDKYVHFLFYLFFTLIWGIALRCNKLKNSIIILLSAVFYGVVIELAQGIFTLTRQPDFYDVVANSCGAFVGWLLLHYYFKWQINKLR